MDPSGTSKTLAAAVTKKTQEPLFAAARARAHTGLHWCRKKNYLTAAKLFLSLCAPHAYRALLFASIHLTNHRRAAVLKNMFRGQQQTKAKYFYHS